MQRARLLSPDRSAYRRSSKKGLPPHPRSGRGEGTKRYRSWNEAPGPLAVPVPLLEVDQPEAWPTGDEEPPSLDRRGSRWLPMRLRSSDPLRSPVRVARRVGRQAASRMTGCRPRPALGGLSVGHGLPRRQSPLGTTGGRTSTPGPRPSSGPPTDRSRRALREQDMPIAYQSATGRGRRSAMDGVGPPHRGATPT
jgi:hypothetical protein